MGNNKNKLKKYRINTRIPYAVLSLHMYARVCILYNVKTRVIQAREKNNNNPCDIRKRTKDYYLFLVEISIMNLCAYVCLNQW